VTVPKIFDLRVTDLLSYRAIAGVLNQDLEAWPPPQPVDPARAVGRWTPSAVREILTNPKYTGFMVWNRRATKDKLHPGKIVPKEQWIIRDPTWLKLVRRSAGAVDGVERVAEVGG
jgi:site-specific DNA recombinase